MLRRKPAISVCMLVLGVIACGGSGEDDETEDGTASASGSASADASSSDDGPGESGGSATAGEGGSSGSASGSSTASSSAGSASTSTGETGDDDTGGGCAGEPPPATFAIASGPDASGIGPYVVLTGTLPSDIEGSPVDRVEVDGSTRGVRIDTAAGTWSYLLAGDANTDHPVSAIADSGASVGPLTAHVAAVGAEALPLRDFAPTQHTVGAWMFTWFTGDPSWDCGSPWRPPGGFVTWDGSVGWAREQLLDQMDAHLDAIGLQLDTATSEGPEAYRFDNVVNVALAAAELLEEGALPPRLFPFVDTAIIADHWFGDNGSGLDMGADSGRAYLYGHARAYYDAAEEAFGTRFGLAGSARFDGLAAIGFWTSDLGERMVGLDQAAVLDFKARFAADYGTEPYFVAHPNFWSDIEAVDEITLMVGPGSHFNIGGRDPTGRRTINVEAGFWNPTSNTFYLPREGGSHFDGAWVDAQAERDEAWHVWIDTWNETGEGSGIFAAEPVTYTGADAGPCDDFVNLHDEAWGPSSRHYIDVVRSQASLWNDVDELDASLLAHDVPATMAAGEQRWVTIAMTNAGDRIWATGGPTLALGAEAAAAGFELDGGAATPDPDAIRLGGVVRGLPGVFTVLLTAPCAPGAHTLTLQMVDATDGGFGQLVSIPLAVG